MVVEEGSTIHSPLLILSPLPPYTQCGDADKALKAAKHRKAGRIETGEGLDEA